MAKKIILLAIAIIVVVVFIFFFVPYMKIEMNNGAFSKAVKQVSSDEISLKELTPFEWDTMYTFSPYMPKENMREIMGVRSIHIRQTISEGMTQLFFIKDGKLVSSIYGYTDNLGFRFDFRKENEGWKDYEYVAFNSSDTIRFQVEKNGNATILTLK